MSQTENPPFLIYQNVDLHVDMAGEIINATTVLWIGFKTSIKPGVKINLHCRCCHINEILVNNIPTEFTHNDPLKDVSFQNKKMEYSSEEVDLNYRAGLEISRNGELEFVVPYLSVGTTEDIPTLPKHINKEVASRCDKLRKQYRYLTTVKDYDKYNVRETEQDSDDEDDAASNKPCFLLQVTIKYSLKESSQSKFNGGFVFRHPSQLSRLFDQSVAHRPKVAPKLPAQCLYTTQYSNGLLYNVDGTRCWLPCMDSLDQRAVFDISITADHKLSVVCCGTKVSTTTTGAAAHKHHHSHSTMAASPSSLKTTRFVTPHRIAAMSVGFFLGCLESYEMPLYKVRAKVHVALGLSDFVSGAQRSEAGHSVNAGEVKFIKRVIGGEGVTRRVRRAKDCADGVSIKTENHDSLSVNDEDDEEDDGEPRNKKSRVSEQSVDVKAETDIPIPPSEAAKHSMDPPAAGTSIHSSSNNSSSKHRQSRHHSSSSPAVNIVEELDSEPLPPARLYSDAVHHSTLGLDMALRIIHKFTSHAYNYSSVSFVYVSDLGTPFLAFDHFALIDASFLHAQDAIYLETTSHLLLIKAYLYSWFKSNVLIGSYLQEYILHGVAGYVLNYYIESVYGEDEARYYYQKQYDSVVALERLGKGFSLYGTTFYPESYAQFGHATQEYMLSKASVLFQLLENKIANGRDPLRIVLKHIISSPSLYKPPQAASNAGTPHDHIHLSGHMSPLSPYGFDSSPFYQDSDTQSATSHSPATSSLMGNLSPGGDLSPYRNTPSGELSPYSGSQSPYAYAAAGGAIRGAQSPYVSGNMSPYSTSVAAGRSDSVDYSSSNQVYNSYTPRHYSSTGDGAVHSPFVHANGASSGYNSLVPHGLTRQTSNMSDATGHSRGSSATDSVNPLSCEGLVSHELFLLILRNASGVSSVVDDSFLDKYIFRSGVLFVKLHLTITDKVENTPRHIHIHTKQVGFSLDSHEINPRAVEKGTIKLRLAEVRDDTLSELFVPLSEVKETFTQQAFARPGRRGGKRRGPKKDELGLENLSPEASAEKERREAEKESRKSALQLVRDLDYPLRYAVVDPLCCDLVELAHGSVTNMLIEQLYTDFYEHSIFFQCQALRNLASNLNITMAPSLSGGGGSGRVVGDVNSLEAIVDRPPSNNLALRAMSNVLLGLSTNVSDGKTVHGASISIYIRAEAAFALAAYQNIHAPATILVDGMSAVLSGSQTSWEASHVLMGCLAELYCEEDDEEVLRPLPNDLSNESSTFLRNSILLALSTVRSQSEHTPMAVVRTVLLFAAYLEQSSYIDPNGEEVSASHDDTHYKAVLYTALSRLRFEAAVRDGPSDLMSGISVTIQNNITAAYTQARALARINYAPNAANRLAELPGRGLDIAAAIAALGEIDVQAIHLYSRGKCMMQPAGSAGKGPFKIREFEFHQPTGKGIFTGFQYKKYFLSPGTQLKCTLDEPQSANSRDEITYHLSSPIVKVAAFEAFVRICFSLHVAQNELYKQMAASGSSGAAGGPKESTFIAATVEALTTLLKGDHDAATKQQFTQVFVDAVQDRAPRTAIQGLSAHNPWYCAGWSDVHGYTLTNTAGKNRYGVEHRAAMNSTGPHMRVATKLLWRSILTSSACDQSLRAVLLDTWMYAFGKNIPSALAKESASFAQNKAFVVQDRYFDGALSEDRVRVRGGCDLDQQFTQVMRERLVVPKAKQVLAAAPDPRMSGSGHNPFANPNQYAQHGEGDLKFSLSMKVK